jgi:hypothetical protein
MSFLHLILRGSPLFGLEKPPRSPISPAITAGFRWCLDAVTPEALHQIAAVDLLAGQGGVDVWGQSRDASGDHGDTADDHPSAWDFRVRAREVTQRPAQPGL